MTHHPVSSSAVASIAYDPATRVLEVRYINGGLYQAEDVPPHVHEALLASPSIGRHLNRLKELVTFTKVTHKNARDAAEHAARA